MKDGLSFSVDVNEFALAAILIVVLALGVGYEYTHRQPSVEAPSTVVTWTPKDIVDACATKEPTITIEQTFFIPVPAPVSSTAAAPDSDLDKPLAPHEDDDNQPMVDPSRQTLLTFEGPPNLPPRKGVTIPDSLRRP